jgi:hypothetical protein
MVMLPTSFLDKLKAIQAGSVAHITEEMSQPIVTVCDVTGEWIWTGATVLENVGGAMLEGTWRKREPSEKCGDYRMIEAEMLAVGPMLIPGSASSYAFTWDGLLPEDWRAAINETIMHDCDPCLRTAMRPAERGHLLGRLLPFLGEDMPKMVNQDFFSFDHGNVMTEEWVNANLGRINDVAGKSWTGSYADFIQRGLWDADLVDAFVAPRPKNPVLTADHPVTGKKFGIFMSIVRRDLTKPWDSTTNPYVVQFVWRQVEKSWIGKVWQWIKNIVVRLINFTRDTICQLASSGAAAGAAGAAMKTGNAYAAGAMVGVAVLGPLFCRPKTQTCFDGSIIPADAICPLPPMKICDGGITVDPTQACPLPKAGLPKWVWIAGGIAAVGALAYFTQKPKRLSAG